MAQRLLLVNPTAPRAQSRRRTSSNAKRTKPMARTAAQRAATKKLIAFNRRRRAPAKKRRRAPASRRRAAPASRRRAAPRRRRARSYARKRVRRNPATATGQRRTYQRTAQMNPRRRRRIRRNPTGRLTMRSITNDLIMPAVTGAVGAIANDALFTYLPLPAQMRAPGFVRYLSKGASAIALTFLASFVVQKRTAMQLGVGALTCLTAEIARTMLQQAVPALAPVAMEGMGLYTMGYYNPALPAGGGIPANNMALYTTGNGQPGLPSLASRETPGVSPGGMGQMVDNHGYSYQ